MEHQDWKPVVLGNSKPKADAPKKVFVQAAGRAKVSIDENGEEKMELKTVPKVTAQAIILARNNKGLKQAELAQKCNFDSKIIADIERGIAIYNFQHINKIAQVLGVKIPRE